MMNSAALGSITAMLDTIFDTTGEEWRLGFIASIGGFEVSIYCIILSRTDKLLPLLAIKSERYQTAILIQTPSKYSRRLS